MGQANADGGDGGGDVDDGGHDGGDVDSGNGGGDVDGGDSGNDVDGGDGSEKNCLKEGQCKVLEAAPFFEPEQTVNHHRHTNHYHLTNTSS